MYSVLRVVLHDTFDYSPAPFSRDAGQLDHLSSITRFNLRLLPTSRGRKNRFFFYLEKRKEVVTISDLRESSGGRFAATAHVEALFSYFVYIAHFTEFARESFLFQENLCSWKNQKRKKVVGEKKKGKKKERVLICQEKKKLPL